MIAYAYYKVIKKVFKTGYKCKRSKVKKKIDWIGNEKKRKLEHVNIDKNREKRTFHVNLTSAEKGCVAPERHFYKPVVHVCFVKRDKKNVKMILRFKHNHYNCFR